MTPSLIIRPYIICRIEILMKQVLTQNQRQSQTQPTKLTKPGFWQRLRQFQPSARLVKAVLAWWVLLVVATTLDMTKGFGIDALSNIDATLYYLCFVVISIFAIVFLVDILILMTLSQATDFQISRKFPSNVPIYHDMDIEVLLTFSINGFFINGNEDKKKQAGSRLLFALLTGLRTLGIVKKINIDFYDVYPDQLLLIDAMPIALSLPLIDLKTDTDIANNMNGEYQSDNYQTGKNQGINQSRIKISYPVIPVERGTGYFGVIHLRVWSPLRLFRRSLIVTAENSSSSPQYLRVLADFSGLLNNQLSVIFEKSMQEGVQALMQQGQGSDFLKLREYSVGDAIRQIDWKASSRLRRLMSKAYEDDNNQDVVFLLDCGEQMRHQDVYHNDSDIDEALHAERLVWQDGANGSNNLAGQTNYFDKVLNAVLLLSYVANKQSDRVGLMTFGGVDVFLSPNKGTTLIRHLLNETADIKPTIQTGDYVVAAQDLMKKLKKRSVVVLITNTRAEATNELTQAVNLLSKRHQVVFANLMEQTISDRLHGDLIPKNMDDALLYHSLMDYQQGRQQLHQLLSQKTGALCLQTTANHLPITLTQAYLSLKRH